METKISEMPCMICWKPIGYDGVVKGIKTKDVKLEVALCRDHSGMTITSLSDGGKKPLPCIGVQETETGGRLNSEAKL